MGCDVLAFGAHPDDVELGCGGLVARLVQLGYRTAVADLTRGERASAGDPARRAAEAEQAAAVLGVAERRNLALADGGLAHGDETQLARVVETLRDLRPFLVLLPFPRCSHPDHVEAGLLVERAAHLAGIRRWPGGAGAEGAAGGARAGGPQPFRPGALLYYESRIPLEPTLVVDVSAQAEAKRRAIACYASQFTREPGAPETTLNAPAFLATFESRWRWLGSLVGVELAEPFVARGPLAVGDPVALFRAVPGPAGRVRGL